MSFLLRVLEPPRYGYKKDGNLYIPTKRELFSELVYNLNIFRTRKNWIQLMGWFASGTLLVFLGFFFARYFSWTLFFYAFIYSMVVLGTHGTIWYHRYSTHRAYQFTNSFWRFITKNLVVKIIPEETYVVSHHVHHHVSEQPGDPYNVNAGWLYCFLADANHQSISKTLTEKEYHTTAKFVNHTGIYINTYKQYLKWGSIANPWMTLMHFIFNWIFWYVAFYLVGGHPLAVTLFGAAGFWAFGVRTFNYDGHGGGKDKRKEGNDFNREDHSINQLWPGLVTGEWHNNHHLYPNGARAGFLWYQLDYAWYYIRFLHFIGGISSYRDYKKDFMINYYLPYLKKNKDLKTSIQHS